jgi:hypothetical protein
MTLLGLKHVVLFLNQSIKTSVALTAEQVNDLNILLVVIHATGCKQKNICIYEWHSNSHIQVFVAVRSNILIIFSDRA